MFFWRSRLFLLFLCIFNVKKIWETGTKKKFFVGGPGTAANMPKKLFSNSVPKAFSSNSGRKSNLGMTVSKSDSLWRQSKRTSETVIIFTVIYICCNIPVFISVLWFTILSTFKIDIFNGNRTDKWFTDNHFWALTYVTLVIINATCNPFVYLFRIKSFRDFVLTNSRLTNARSTNTRFITV